MIFINIILGQTLLKTPVVMESHEEVHPLLGVQAKTTEDNSSSSESQLDAVSAEVESVSIKRSYQLLSVNSRTI